MVVLVAAVVVAGPLRAQAPEDPLPAGPDAPATAKPPASPEDEVDAPEAPRAANAPAPRYVVWRIKPGTGAGALAPRFERRVRKEMEHRLGDEMLSKAAQTGIILIRPELADCDANLPCALDVADALNIRFVVGGEAEVITGGNVVAWLIDKERGAEVRRVSVAVEGTGPEAEQAAVLKLTDALLAPDRVAQVDGAAPSRATSAGESPPASPVRRMAGMGLVGAGALAAMVGVVGGVLGVVALGAGAVFAGLSAQYHTVRLRSLMTGLLLGGGVGLGLGAALLLAALVACGVGAWAILGVF